MDGFLNLYKEEGMTSHQAVARARRILGTKKIGHAGTLDPLATGVLPLCIGKATRAVQFLTEGTKTYLAAFQLGIITDTEDATGAVLERREVMAGKEEVQKALLNFTGEILQVPPMYSAVKKGGQTLYKLARAGKEVEREARRVQIGSITPVPNPSLARNEYQIRVVCQKGTYIRTLCADIGKALGCGAVLTSLVREGNGIFTSCDAVTLTTLENLVQKGRLSEVLLPLDRIFDKYPLLVVDKEQERLIKNGATLSLGRVSEGEKAEGLVRVYAASGEFLLLAEARKEKDELARIKAFY